MRNARRQSREQSGGTRAVPAVLVLALAGLPCAPFANELGDNPPLEHWTPAFAAYDQYAGPTGFAPASALPRLRQTEITIESIQTADDFRRWRIQPLARRAPTPAPQPAEQDPRPQPTPD